MKKFLAMIVTATMLGAGGMAVASATESPKSTTPAATSAAKPNADHGGVQLGNLRRVCQRRAAPRRQPGGGAKHRFARLCELVDICGARERRGVGAHR